MHSKWIYSCGRLSVIAATLGVCSVMPLNAGGRDQTGQAQEIENKPGPTGLQEAPDWPIGFESDEELRREHEREESVFINRFNRLLDALRDFSSTYNAGHVIDVKKVRAIHKAMRQLEKSPWFRSQKGE